MGFLDPNSWANALSDDPTGAKTATQTQVQSQEKIYNQQREDFKPYQEMGTEGVKAYNKFISDPNAYMQSPAYQWQQQQIDQNMNRQLSARGRGNSSYGIKSLANAYGNLGTSEYTNAYNRMLDPIKIGQGAANSAGSAGNAMSNAYGAAGQQMVGIGQTNYANRQNSLYGNAGMALSAYNTFKPQGNSDAWGAYSGTVDNYSPYTTYAGDSPGPWAMAAE